MAKKKTQTLEEALVPENEQPYAVPENWVWTQLGNLLDIKTGKEDANFAVEDGKYLFFTCAEDALRCNISAFSGESILVAGNGAFHVNYYDGEFNAYQRTYVLQNFKAVLGKFAYYHTIRDIQRITSGNRGSTIRYIRLGDLTDSTLPLPPLAEQRRIVARIESLFEKLDHARELVQTTLDSFETRKAAILHRAFTGELTAQWRAEHGVGMDSWKRTSITDICTSLQYGTSNKSQKTGEIVVIRMGNLQHGEITWDDLAYANKEDDIPKYLLHEGDVLFNRTNSPELVGKTSIYRGEKPAIFAGYLIRLNYKKTVVAGEFLNYILNSVDAKDYCNKVKTDGVNQSNINAKKIGAYSFACPSLPEQQEIVRILDGLLEKEQKAKEQLEPVLDQIDLMKKSILARAFRGELGTNDPSEESAVGLLREMQISK